MSGFNDLIPRAQPAFMALNAAGTEGDDWEYTVGNIRDNAGALIDFADGVTGVCKIITKVGGQVLAQPTFTGGLGTVTLSLPSASTTGLAGGDLIRRVKWTCRLTKAGKRIHFFSAVHSEFRIEPEEA